MCILLALALPSRVAAEKVCVAGEWRAQFKEARFVALAEVTSLDQNEHGGTFSLRVVRSWKGSAKQLKGHSRGGEDDGWLTVGQYVLVYAPSVSVEFDVCSQPWPVYYKSVQTQITQLDRLRKFPPLSLPSQALRDPRAPK
jgi:hypothetical protein